MTNNHLLNDCVIISEKSLLQPYRRIPMFHTRRWRCENIWCTPRNSWMLQLNCIQGGLLWAATRPLVTSTHIIRSLRGWGDGWRFSLALSLSFLLSASLTEHQSWGHVELRGQGAEDSDALFIANEDWMNGLLILNCKDIFSNKTSDSAIIVGPTFLAAVDLHHALSC